MRGKEFLKKIDWALVALCGAIVFYYLVHSFDKATFYSMGLLNGFGIGILSRRR
jgi:hypothetical protein